ncbi:angiopoietin-related protein 7-like [Argopecten irradians]|uniref:angiopoietin-related protein 7-like n=1 Tax=Argopecten irradians TaxID=31199 RepID=UPI0037103074
MEVKLCIVALVFSTVESFTRVDFPQLSKRVLRVVQANQSLYKLDSFFGISNHAVCAKNCKTELCFAFSYTTDDSICETYSRAFEESTYAEISKSTLHFNKVIYINSCADLIGHRSGVYKIRNDGPMVYCDMDTEGGPWTVIQRRTKGDVDFYRLWSDYKKGFGDLQRDFWLGNDNLHLLTNISKILRVEVEALTGERGYAEYSNFQVADESQNYKLIVNGFSGNLSHDGMAYSNNCQFTTRDRDNDNTNDRHCGQRNKSGWWHNRCVYAQLNGIFRKSIVDSQVMRWSYFPDPSVKDQPLKTTKMMIR